MYDFRTWLEETTTAGITKMLDKLLQDLPEPIFAATIDNLESAIKSSDLVIPYEFDYKKTKSKILEISLKTENKKQKRQLIHVLRNLNSKINYKNIIHNSKTTEIGFMK